MRRYTSIKVIAVFAIMLVIIFSAYWLVSTSLRDLVKAVHESSKPDLVLIKINEIYSDITLAESGVRAFTLTQDENYLAPYQKLVNTFNNKIDTLRFLTKDKIYEVAAIDSLSSLLKQKLEVYDELLGISYNNILQSALGKITSQFSVKDSVIIDTLKITEERKSFLKKIFGSPSKTSLKIKAETAQKESERSKEKISNVQKTIADIEQQESHQLKEQTEKELALLNKDKIIKQQIEKLIRKIEHLESLHLREKAEEANASVEKSSTTIKLLIIAGAVIVLLLILLILYDITQINLYRKELSKSKLQAEHLAKIKEEFLANMSHEIRTPLSAIMGYAWRLQKTILNEKQINYANAINTSSEHLLSIVNDILDLTKIESGNLHFEKINFKPAEIVQEVCDALKLKADEKILSLFCDVESINKFVVSSDPLRLKQVLFNLVGNAIKFTEKGKVEIIAVAEAKGSQNHPALSGTNFKFQISDTGIGIADEKLKIIFNQFLQADSSISRKFGGSGLGLSISKKIIELQGGKIEVKSQLLKGSEFTVTIPYEVIQTMEEGQETGGDKQAKKPKTGNWKPEGGKILSGVKILLAEDVEINRILQVEMLKDLGAEVDEAVNGYEILSRLRTQNYQLLLVDIQMPGMSGIDAIKTIRGNLKSNIPALAMTANVMQQDLDSYLTAGFNDYITKPFKEKELAEKIRNLLNGYQSPFRAQPETDHISATDLFFDLDDLIKASGGNDEFVIRMIKLFISSTEDSLRNIEQLIAKNDFRKVNLIVHKMIPSYKHLNIFAAVKELQLIEINTREEKNIEEIKKKIEHVKVVSEKVISELINEISRLEKKLS